MPILLWIVTALLAQQPASSPGVSSLDYEYFKTRVQPIFLTKRTGYTRCIVCHSSGGAAGYLQPLSSGATTWTEEESRKNFESVSKLVTPGDPMKSRLLVHPLEPAAGGSEYHSGGRQFTSTNDPDFQTIANWVRGKK
jgi:hypothetical protein